MNDLMNDQVIYFIAKIFVTLHQILFINTDFENKMIIGLIFVFILMFLFIPIVREMVFELSIIAIFFATVLFIKQFLHHFPMLEEILSILILSVYAYALFNR